MFATAIIVAFGITAFMAIGQAEQDLKPLSAKLSGRLQKLWGIAQSGMREKKYLRAEKALLTILKLDQKNAAAYNRLGILYSRQKEYKDAIECFEIASSIQPSSSSLHNLGLIYYETENYEKAAHAFEHALEMEDTLAARHIAYAKVQEKLGNTNKMLTALENAVEQEPKAQTIKLLSEAYEREGHTEEAKKMRARLNRATKSKRKQLRIKRPNRVIY